VVINPSNRPKLTLDNFREAHGKVIIVSNSFSGECFSDLTYKLI
jgi:hypothetical protein